MVARVWSGCLIALGFAVLLVAGSPGEARTVQQVYRSPEEAVAALAAAARTHDRGALRAIFGAEAPRLLGSGDPYAENEDMRRFAEAYQEKHAIVPLGPGRAQLEIGETAWPLPIPIVQTGELWRFDTQAGAQEIINRRIGRNELSAVHVALAYVQAQREYFSRMQRQTGAGFYADRLISTPGRQDGLYWPATSAADASPLGALIDYAQAEGYPGVQAGGRKLPYHGYYFRILMAQGSYAPGGASHYVRSDKMSEGFALIAWPARYGASGVVTFEVNQDGVVFQKDLGPNTPNVAARITLFDPDLSWAKVELSDR